MNGAPHRMMHMYSSAYRIVSGSRSPSRAPRMNSTAFLKTKPTAISTTPNISADILPVAAMASAFSMCFAPSEREM